jgi:hypothetical protein
MMSSTLVVARFEDQGCTNMKPHNSPVAALMFLLLANLAACASAGASVDVTSEASSSSYFRLSRPSLYKTQGGLSLVGRVCRLGRTTLLSPPRVRLEHLDASGSPVEIAHAPLGAIYRNPDQPCTDYAARVGWTLTEGDTVRACFERGRACPTASAAKAVVPVPAPPTGRAPE